VDFLELVAAAVPDRAQLFGKILYEQLPEFTYSRIIRQLPQLAPKFTYNYNHLY